MIFDRLSWDEICKGYVVVDGTIGFEPGRLGFLLVEDCYGNVGEVLQTRFLAVKLANPIDRRFYVRRGDTLRTATLSAAWAPQQYEFVMVDTIQRVWSYQPNAYRGSEAPIPFDTDGKGFGLVMTKVLRVGSTVYAIGGPFCVFRRLPGQQWQAMPGIALPDAFVGGDLQQRIAAIDGSTLRDLAGLSEADLYAVGDTGTVWHFDGKRWRQCAFPTTGRLSTVACAGDGKVYITDEGGRVWRGQRDTWNLLCKGDAGGPFADSAWYGGRLWLSNGLGLHVLEGEHIVRAHQAGRDPAPEQVGICGQRVDVSPDGRQMLVCGGDGAALHDADGWHMLFSGRPAAA